jgi:spore coat protein A
MDASRRDVLKAGGLGVLGAVGAAALPFGNTIGASTPSTLDPSRVPQPFRSAFARPPVLRPRGSVRGKDGVWTDHFSVTMRATRAEVIPGLTTRAFGYNGSVPGPTIKVKQGRRAVVRFRNHLPAVNPVSGQDFKYPNFQRARTLWYHDHGVHHTAQNAYSGLYAQYHLHDPAERDLLPQGEFDVPLVVVDAMFKAGGGLGYDDNSHSGLWGDVVTVNGRAWPVMKVKRRVYRFRVLNASISRSYRFTLDNGDPVTVVATDGGLMPRARDVSEWRHGNAERYEVLIDFRRYRPGQRVVLRNLSNPNNLDFDDTDKVMAFDVTDAPFDTSDPTWNRIPDTLADSDVMRLKESDASRVRRLQVKRTNGSWTINGQTWDDVVNSQFQLLVANPRLNSTEIWEIENTSGGWFHPVHIHLVDFKVLSRDGRRPFDYELGPKDVVYTGEKEIVRVIMRFGPHRGRYMVHCHNLPHEDHDMMQQFGVGWRPGREDRNDPILAAPCKVDNLPRRA